MGEELSNKDFGPSPEDIEEVVKPEEEDFKRYTDISDLFREHVLSGKEFGSLSFIEEAEKIENVPLLIKISASELPKGKEKTYCNVLKAFIDNTNIGKNAELDGKKVYGRLAKKILIEGTQEDHDHLIKNGCSNALASGVGFRLLDSEGNFIRDI